MMVDIGEFDTCVVWNGLEYYRYFDIGMAWMCHFFVSYILEFVESRLVLHRVASTYYS